MVTKIPTGLIFLTAPLDAAQQNFGVSSEGTPTATRPELLNLLLRCGYSRNAR